ncbi:MAG: reactive intermediate/imine deaminase [Planctomycetes bacterium]|jgi:2-iminobutanoate/2-iminopropanoate deaminase|nr:reactive intermediate/imine deaminase [Planctomycetota bacterium]
MTQLTAVTTKEAPAAIGPYSQAIRAGDLIFCSGQIPIDPATGNFVEGGIEEQTRRCLENLQNVLAEAGSGLERAVRMTVFLKNMEDFPRVNEVYATFFSNVPPSRATVEVSRLPKDAMVEIDCIACAS